MWKGIWLLSYLTSLWVQNEDSVLMCLRIVVLALVSDCIMQLVNPENSMFLKKMIMYLSHFSVLFYYSKGSVMSYNVKRGAQTEYLTTHACLHSQLSLFHLFWLQTSDTLSTLSNTSKSTINITELFLGQDKYDIMSVTLTSEFVCFIYLWCEIKCIHLFKWFFYVIISTFFWCQYKKTNLFNWIEFILYFI